MKKRKRASSKLCDSTMNDSGSPTDGSSGTEKQSEPTPPAPTEHDACPVCHVVLPAAEYLPTFTVPAIGETMSFVMGILES